MRTTITLDKDVAQLIDRLLRKSDATKKELINAALRKGLAAIERPGPTKAFRTKQVSLKPRVADIDDIAEVLALAEGEDFR